MIYKPWKYENKTKTKWICVSFSVSPSGTFFKDKVFLASSPKDTSQCHSRKPHVCFDLTNPMAQNEKSKLWKYHVSKGERQDTLHYYVL